MCLRPSVVWLANLQACWGRRVRSTAYICSSYRCPLPFSFLCSSSWFRLRCGSISSTMGPLDAWQLQLGVQRSTNHRLDRKCSLLPLFVQLLNAFYGDISSYCSPGFSWLVVPIAYMNRLDSWLIQGWIAVRRELRIPMLIFLAMSVGYFAGWGGMFASSTFRWTFVNWRFFSVIVSASLFLTLITLIVGLVCRINFGKGLPRYRKRRFST